MEPASCYRKVAVLIPLVCMSKCPWAKYWTPNCSWCAGLHHGSHHHHHQRMNVCLNYCKSLWTKASAKCKMSCCLYELTSFPSGDESWDYVLKSQWHSSFKFLLKTYFLNQESSCGRCTKLKDENCLILYCQVCISDSEHTLKIFTIKTRDFFHWKSIFLSISLLS